MIKHLLLIVDQVDDDAIIDIESVLSSFQCLKGTNIIITDTVQSAMTTMQVMTVKGSLN